MPRCPAKAGGVRLQLKRSGDGGPSSSMCFMCWVPTSCQPFQNMKPQKSCRTLNWQSLNAGSFTELSIGPSPQKKAMAIPTSRYEATQSTKDHVATWGICSANSTSFKGKVEALRFFLKALFPTHGIHVIDTQLTACVQ